MPDRGEVGALVLQDPAAEALPSRPTHPVGGTLARLKPWKLEVVPIVLDPGIAGPLVVVDLRARGLLFCNDTLTNGGTACPTSPEAS